MTAFKQLFCVVNPVVHGLDYSKPPSADFPTGPALGDYVELVEVIQDNSPAPLLCKFKNGYHYRYERANLEPVKEVS